jgi:hypothetical protein
MLLARTLITEAYKEAGIIGQGMTLTSEQMTQGLSSLQGILDEAYGDDAGAPTQALSVTLPGTPSFTIGPMPADPLMEPVPDVALNVVPASIDKIAIRSGGVRYISFPATPETFFNRALETNEDQYPTHFYYEKSYPLSTVRWVEGQATGEAEIVYRPSLVDPTLNTDLGFYPRALRPYLRWELASIIAEQNTFESNTLRSRSQRAWNTYQRSVYEGQAYAADGSAPNRQNGRFNIYSGE